MVTSIGKRGETGGGGIARILCNVYVRLSVSEDAESDFRGKPNVYAYVPRKIVRGRLSSKQQMGNSKRQAGKMGNLRGTRVDGTTQGRKSMGKKRALNMVRL